MEDGSYSFQVGIPALSLASMQSNVEIVQLLLDKGAEVNKADKVGNARE